jgi:hypothetical protein
VGHLLLGAGVCLPADLDLGFRFGLGFWVAARTVTANEHPRPTRAGLNGKARPYDGYGKRAEKRESLKGKTLPYLITQSRTAT